MEPKPQTKPGRELFYKFKIFNYTELVGCIAIVLAGFELITYYDDKATKILRGLTSISTPSCNQT